MFRRFSLALVLCCLSSIESFGVEAKVLSIGSDAPKLDIEHWMSNGQGKFKPVKSFEKGNVYIVEFWATTCGPCVQSIPHLVELQEKYSDKGLQIIGVTSETPDLVRDFLPTKAKDTSGASTTIGALTERYCLTADPDGTTEVDYMLAAKQNGIPTAFVVGKDAKIEWIGHPMEIDGVIDEVINDKWDRAKYKAEQDLLAEIQTSLGKLMRVRKYPEAIAKIDDFVARVDKPQLKFGLLKTKIDLQVMAASSSEELGQTFDTLYELTADEPMFAQDVAWTAYQYFIEDKIESKKIIRSSIAAVEKTLDKLQGEMLANVLDTLAHLKFVAGDLAGAIEAETKANTLMDGKEPSIKDFLKELKAVKK
jgi:thiol-disulfide isomerase/thioredoxin